MFGDKPTILVHVSLDWATHGVKVKTASKFHLLGKLVVYEFLIKILMIKLILGKSLGENFIYLFIFKLNMGFHPKSAE